MYCSVEELREFVRIPDEEDDDFLELCISAASSAIDSATNTSFEDPAPDAIKLATLLQASRFTVRRDSPYGIAGSPETSEMRLLAKVDPDVAVIIRPFYVWWAVAPLESV